ncbi:MAG: UDP-N-acetylglucosamine 1-carboxyvinyltransferase [Christensenellales bacterium]|jgi:UDP-N-acetylglucosamine 1-carboxyvinyltransferase
MRVFPALEHMEKKLVVTGGIPLRGSVEVSGGKNAAVAIIPAALLCREECVIDNLPSIDDVKILCEILSTLGAEAQMETPHRLRINAAGLKDWRAPAEKIKRMRASYYLMGVLLGRFGKAEVGIPGGCEIGLRPMDQHIKGFEAMGAHVELTSEGYHLEANPLTGGEVYLDMASVGATINIMLAAVLSQGNTTIVNAAKEPHVVDLANFLGAMGARIKGAGTDVIRIHGVEKLNGCQYSIIPDQIETGTLMIMAAATGGDVMVRNVIPTHLESLSAKLMEAGATVIEGNDTLRVRGLARPRAISIKTLPYPGFPTDLQQPMTAYLTRATGTSIITETIYESRYRYAEELQRMGANIRVADRMAVVEGVPHLYGTTVQTNDLRAGAAMIVAGLIAEGETHIRKLRHIDRGYESIEDKLASLGANIKRVSDEEN